MSVSITFVILTVAITMIEIPIGPVKLSTSSLLSCMMLGTVFCNICESSEELMDRVDRWTTPVFVLFFVISGAELDLSVFTVPAIIGVGVVYIIFRSLGKIVGSAISSKATKCGDTIVKYLGITLLPQAGVALGMSVTAMQLGQTEGALVRNIILFSVLVYELIGPIMTKKALVAAGEIKPENNTSAKILNDPDGNKNRHK